MRTYRSWLRKRRSAIGSSISTGTGRVKIVNQAEVFELRTYTTNKGKLPNLNSRFRDHTVRLFEKHGMKSIGYWTPTDKEETLVYVISHKSREAAKASWKAFGADPEWKKVAAESQKDGRILAKRPEAVYMTATDYSPA